MKLAYPTAEPALMIPKTKFLSAAGTLLLRRLRREG